MFTQKENDKKEHVECDTDYQRQKERGYLSTEEVVNTLNEGDV